MVVALKELLLLNFALASSLDLSRALWIPILRDLSKSPMKSSIVFDLMIGLEALFTTL